MNTITRKIQLIIEDSYNESYSTLKRWNEIVFRSYNYVSTHLYIQENLKEFFYMNDDIKINLSHRENNEGIPPILKTSRQNTTYQLLSSKFKGDIPTSILTALNQNVKRLFSAERKNYFAGSRSLRTYRRGVPIPFQSKDIKNCILHGDSKNYKFQLFNINFRTNFGRDLSNNKLIFENGLINNSYKFCDSSLQLSKGKIFLLAVFQFKSEPLALNKEKIANIKLDLYHPMIVTIGNKTFNIGTKEEYLHRRLAIRRSMQKLQSAIKYNEGGNGRKKKLAALERYKKLEKNYVDSRLHKYSKDLINICTKYKCGKIVLIDQSDEMKSIEERINQIKKDNNLTYNEKSRMIENSKFVISNWSYYGLLTKIEYKANIIGIEINK